MRTAPAILWASAFIIAALVIVTAGRLPENAAHAEMATTGLGGFSMLTVPSGYGPADRPYEVLCVIDNQSQSLYIYAIENATDRRVILRGGAFLPNLFRVGRGG